MANKKSKIKRKVFNKKTWIFSATLIILFIFIYWQNNGIMITEYKYKNEKIPNSFNGFQILHISDLHNKEFGKNQEKLLLETKKINPDVIVMTGDLVDSHRLNLNVSLQYVKGALKIAPIFYVSGNHEIRTGIYDDIIKQLDSLGVHVLDNEHINLNKNGDSISLLGLKDPYLNQDNLADEYLSILKDKASSDFKILLSHRPELYSIYVKHEIDLVFSGHAHGGQFRIPFLGGLYAPNQGFFPKYSSGLYQKDKTHMIVSRGLGNSVIPVRLFNRPELIVVTLTK